MKKMIGLSVVLAVAPFAQAADIEAGKARAATVCAACHGANGVSVSDTIPNLAAQRAAYLETQLKAFKEGTRRAASATSPTAIMTAIAAQLSADGKPATGADGNFVAEKPVAYTAMARDVGWGKDIPEMLRNENWNYAVFTTDKQHRPGVNQAECLGCHKPLDNVSYTFTLKQLAKAK